MLSVQPHWEVPWKLVPGTLCTFPTEDFHPYPPALLNSNHEYNSFAKFQALPVND